MKKHFKDFLFSALFIQLVLCVLKPAYADVEAELALLRLYYNEEELVYTPTRFPKPKSQAAENITVITAEDIEKMNAHTLAEALAYLPGVQIDAITAPGGLSQAYIQGSYVHHVLLLIDNIEMNILMDDVAYINMVPVQNIERIEIIRGPASSAWGSSLGGVINVITKAPSARKLAGNLSMSYGEKNTVDYRSEFSGRLGRFSYYLYGGGLSSNGFAPNKAVWLNSLYAKFGYDISNEANLLFTLGYNKNVQGLGHYTSWDFSKNLADEQLFSTLSLDYRLEDNTGLNLAVKTNRLNETGHSNTLSTGEEFFRQRSYEKTDSGSLRLHSKQGGHDLVLGSDLSRSSMTLNSFYDSQNGMVSASKWAVYANDTFTLGRLAITPGLRYDHSSSNEELLSPSLGLTFRLTDRTLLRLNGAGGFTAPGLGSKFSSDRYVVNPDLRSEKIWSLQAGLETSSFKYLWLKVMLFNHNIRDGLDYEAIDAYGKFTEVNKARVRREGLEIEAKTLPLHNISFSGGLTLIRARDLDTGQKITLNPEATVDLGLGYDDNKSFTGLLKGHYIRWNVPADWNGKYNAFICDLFLTKKVYQADKKHIELFLTARNLFNGSQYYADLLRNPGRWYEAGLRYKF